MLGRLTPQKRFEDAVQAFARVAATEPGATLDIYGDGEQWTLVEQQIRHAGLENVVRLRGFDPQAKERLAEATALLLTSRFEGYPLVVLEALRRGCPVIAYDIAYGPREQLTDGENGFLVRPGDLEALAERIVRLARDRALATRMSEAARASAADHSVGQYLQNWRAVLQGVQARRRGTAT
jgi:poly(glycerol-phosphate) alpha-glucosyltransferase